MVKVNDSGTESGQTVVFPIFVISAGFLFSMFVCHSLNEKVALTKKDKASAKSSHRLRIEEQSINRHCPKLFFLKWITIRKLLHALSLAAIAAGFCYMLNGMLLYHQINKTSCNYMGSMGALSYSYLKCFIYGGLILRLKASYAETEFDYSRKLTLSLHGINFGMMIFATFSCVTGRVSEKLGESSDGGLICKTTYPRWGEACIIGYDFLMHIFLLALFLRPLLLLAKHQRMSQAQTKQYLEDANEPQPSSSEPKDLVVNVDANTPNPVGSMDLATLTPWKPRQSTIQSYRGMETFRLSVRTTLLTALMIISTLVAIAMRVFFDISVFLVVDIWINCICLLLTFGIHKHCYYRLCKHCDHCLVSCVATGIEYHVTEELRKSREAIPEPKESDAPDE